MIDSHSPTGDDDTLAGEGDRPPTRGALDLRAGSAIGRYLALERLAAGGMGVVWSAYDPELDRKVAIKLLLADGGGSMGRARLLREAQAMARLAHPNVVTVHDVGTLGEAVFVAMELVQGWTLSAWLRRSPRRWTEVLEVMVAAGRGVAGAHDAGLVHRDIKPDNIMIGADGRVRVMDFGLARDGRALDASADDVTTSQSLTAVDITMAGAVVGTPAYMPPEQWAGELPDARGDQFSFCVTCWEAVYGAPPFSGKSLVELASQIGEGQLQPPPASSPVPRWVGRTLVRGLSTRAADRFESMRDLLDALQAGRRRARRQVIGVALIGTILVGSAFAVQRAVAHRQALHACTAKAGSIAELWPGAHDDARTEVAAAFAATGLHYADDTFERTQARLDAYASELGEAVGGHCEAELEVATPTAALVRACLDERRSALHALIEIFRDADGTTLQRASSSALGLPRIADCLDTTLVARRQAPDDEELALEVATVRDRLEAVGMHYRAGRLKAALEESQGALASAQSIDWPPLVAEAHMMVGTVASATGDYERGERELLAAFTTATAVGNDDVALEAASRLVNLVGAVGGRHAEGMIWAHVAEALLERLGETEGLGGANFFAEFGNLEYSRGDPAAAEREHRRALERHLALLGERDIAVAHGHARLGADAMAAGNTSAALEHYERAVVLFESILGPGHPDLADYLNGLGATHRALGNDVEAERLFAQAGLILERAFGPDSVAVAQSISNVALIRLERGDNAGARPELERALAILERALGPDHVDLSTVLVNLGLVYSHLGRLDDAERVGARALAIRESILGADHPAVARALVLVGDIYRSQGRASEAVPLLERALGILATHDVQSSQIAEAELHLGAALWTIASDDRRAIELVTSARRRFATEPEAQEKNLAQADTWLREHPRPR